MITDLPAAVVRLLDDPATLRSAHDDPTGSVEHEHLMLIDEIQLAPELLRPTGRHGELMKLLGLLVSRTAALLVPATLANLSGIPRTTLIRYLELLNTVFLIKSVPAWSTNHTARAVGTPTLAFVDTGIACHLLGQDSNRLGEPGGAAGALVENFVLMELARQLTWSQERGRLSHYRTKDRPSTWD